MNAVTRGAALVYEGKTKCPKSSPRVRRGLCMKTCEKSFGAFNRKRFDERIIGAEGPERSFEHRKFARHLKLGFTR